MNTLKGKREENPQSIEAIALLKTALAEICVSGRDQGFSSGPSPEDSADPEKVRQALKQLVNNVIDGVIDNGNSYKDGRLLASPAFFRSGVCDARKARGGIEGFIASMNESLSTMRVIDEQMQEQKNRGKEER